MSWARLRSRNLKIPADLRGREVVDFVVPRHGGRLSSCAVDENRMPTPLAKDFAPMLFQVSDEVPALHPAIGRFSLIARRPASVSSASVRFASRTSPIAS